MSYLAPSEFVSKMVDAGESKIYMSTRDTVIRAYMAGAILALAAVFAVSIAIATESHLIGSLCFPVGFSMLYLMGFDLLTGVFVLTPLAWLDKRPGVTWKQILRNWGLVFLGNFAGALTVAAMMSFIFTYGYNTDGGAIATKVAGIGEARTLGYAKYGIDGWFTIFIRGMLQLPPDAITQLQVVPYKGSLPTAVPTDPLIYRFYELISIYGTTFKALIHEEFGDGIMSAIDFNMEIKREADPKGDRVNITMSGKFLPYKSY